MPELPEVETVKEGLRPAMEGHRIRVLSFLRQNLRHDLDPSLPEQVMGQKIVSLTRRAKYILIALENDLTLISHLGMSGSFQIEKDANFERQKHDHIIIELQNGTHIVYNDPRRFGMFFGCPSDAVDTHSSFANLGVEPLDKGFDGAYLAQLFQGKQAPVKIALMDQRLVVGVGNIYASEALHMSKIHPKRAAGRISRKRLDSLALAVKEVLTQAIKAGGSSLRDHRQTDGTMGYFQHSFKVYDKAGQYCESCFSRASQTGQKIKKIIQAGRSTFYCPKCQK